MRLTYFVVLAALFRSYSSEPYFQPGSQIFRNFLSKYPTFQSSLSGIPFPYTYASPYNHPQMQQLPPMQNVFFPIVLNAPQVNVQPRNFGPHEEISVGYSHPLQYSRSLMHSGKVGDNYNTQQRGPLVQLMRLFFESESQAEKSKFGTKNLRDDSQEYQSRIEVEQVQSPSAEDDTTSQMQRLTDQQSPPQKELKPKSQSKYASYDVNGFDHPDGSELNLKLLESENNERLQTEETTTEQDEPAAIDNSKENQIKLRIFYKIFLQPQEDTAQELKQESTLPELSDLSGSSIFKETIFQQEQNPKSDKSFNTNNWEQIMHTTERLQGELSQDLQQKPTLLDSEEDLEYDYSSVFDVESDEYMERYIRRARQANNLPEEEQRESNIEAQMQAWLEFKKILVEKTRVHLPCGAVGEQKVRDIIADLHQHYQQELDRYGCTLSSQNKGLSVKCVF